jgi:hypothetical protein
VLLVRRTYVSSCVIPGMSWTYPGSSHDGPAQFKTDVALLLEAGPICSGMFADRLHRTHASKSWSQRCFLLPICDCLPTNIPFRRKIRRSVCWPLAAANPRRLGTHTVNCCRCQRTTAALKAL